MAKTKLQKENMLNSIKSKIKDSKSLIISVFDKLNVNADQELRSELRKNSVEHEVIKKTLLTKAFGEEKMTDLPEDQLIGNISISSSEDEVMGAKVLAKFAKNNEGFKIIGGLLNNIWASADKINELSKLPTKPELIAKTVGTIKAPLSSFVNVLSGNLRGLVNALNAIKNNK